MSAFQAYLLFVALQVTVAAAMAIAIASCFRRQAAMRHAVGIIGLALLLSAPLTVTLLPRPAWTTMEPTSTVAVTSSAAWKNTTAFDDADRLDPRPSAVPTTGSISPAPLPTSEVNVPAANPAVHEFASPNPVDLGAKPRSKTAGSLAGSFAAMAALVWLAGIAWGAGRLWRSHRALQQLCRPLRMDSPDGAVVDETEICTALGMAKLPPILLSDLVPVPVVLGLFRPVMLLPRKLVESATRMQLKNILLHEGAHIARRDPWVLAAQQVAATLYWWHPGVHALNRQIRQAREEVCDNYVLKHSRPEDYAELLLSLAEACRTPHFALSLLGLFSMRWRLEDRISGLLHPKRETVTRAKRGHVAALTVAIVTPCLLIGGIGLIHPLALRAQTQSDESAPNSSAKADVPKAQPETAQPLSQVAAEPPAMRKMTIRGVCVDEKAVPIADALVQVYRTSSRIDPPVMVTESQTDQEGKFAIADVETAIDQAAFRGMGDLVVVAKAAGRVSAFSRIDSDEKARAVSLKLEGNAGSLSGTVIDEAGRPVAGVTVYLSCGLGHPIPGVRSAVTDRDGRYVISDLKRWTPEETRTFDPKTGIGHMVTGCNFLLEHPDYPRTTAQHSAIPQTVDVTLHPAAIVEGRVIDAVTDRPVANAVVSAQAVARSGWFQTRTDGDGRYRLHMTKDHYNIWSEAADRMPIAVKALEAIPGRTTTDADIRLVKGGFVFGTVIDAATNQPVVPPADHPLQVAHYGPARPRTGAAVTSTNVNADGTYRLHVAPGSNYVYLMSGGGRRVVEVKDGEEVRVDLRTGEQPEQDAVQGFDADVQLSQKLYRKAAEEDAARERAARGEPEPAKRPRSTTPTGLLLEKLRDLNEAHELKDPLCRTLKEIVDLGPQAVPQLIDELDSTRDERMLRCLGFVLRAIGDKRAVPALIRAIPKTLQKSGSDAGLIAEDPELVKFAQRHDLRERNEGNEYGFGRPVREICGALQKLTGQKLGEEELYSSHLDGTAHQQEMKRALYHRVASVWAQWWERHWSEHLQDDSYARVHLPERSSPKPAPSPKPGTHFRTGGGGSNWILESVLNPKAKKVFYDFDTGRVGALPQKWRTSPDIAAQIDEIVTWASQEGFDLMGTEYVSPANGEHTYALKPIGLRVWELSKERWKMTSKDITVEQLQAEGTPTDGLLFHHDRTTEAIDPKSIGSFLYLTREGTPGLLYVGIEVKDDSLKEGIITTGDDELDPVAFRKGRRFAFTHLEELDGENAR
jgi:beta-lactamase regulating signal transducer with metallopeptidase domain